MTPYLGRCASPVFAPCHILWNSWHSKFNSVGLNFLKNLRSSLQIFILLISILFQQDINDFQTHKEFYIVFFCTWRDRTETDRNATPKDNAFYSNGIMTLNHGFILYETVHKLHRIIVISHPYLNNYLNNEIVAESIKTKYSPDSVNAWRAIIFSIDSIPIIWWTFDVNFVFFSSGYLTPK